MKKIFIFFVLLFSIGVQSQTVEDVRDLIDSNLASGTKITAEKHRQVEHSIVTLIENKNAFLYKNNFFIGDVLGSVTKLVTFPNVGTSSYIVMGSLISQGSNFTLDNTVVWQIREKTSTSFKLCLAETGGQVQNISFDYVIVPF